MDENLHFVNPCPNATSMAFGLITSTEDCALRKQALDLLQEITAIRAGVFGRPTSGHTATAVRLARGFKENIHNLDKACVLANLAFYGAEAMQLLCLCMCNKLMVVDRALLTGKVEETATITMYFLEAIQDSWNAKDFHSSHTGLKEQSQVWTAHLRKLMNSHHLGEPSSPLHLPFRRLREETKNDCCLIPAKDGWLVCTYPDDCGDMTIIGEGTDVPHAVSDALTSLLPTDAEPNIK